MIVWVAEYDSPHFDFRAAGSTREAALEALRSTLRRHARSHTLEADWYGDADLEDNATLIALTLDAVGTRDGETV